MVLPIDDEVPGVSKRAVVCCPKVTLRAGWVVVPEGTI